MKIVNSVDINARPEVVFPWISDPEKAMVWQTSVSKGEIIHETPGVVGTTFRETVEEEGQGTELEGVITNYVPNREMSFHLEGIYNSADVTFSLEDVDGRTRVEQRADVQFKGITRIMSLIMGPVFKKNVSAQMKKEFMKLKELCESRPDDMAKPPGSGTTG
jgi:carbon monoxide dehydrogenase subunit G